MNDNIKNTDGENKERHQLLDKASEKLDKLSIENYASWRDSLHKYFSIIFVMIGVISALKLDNFSDIWFKAGIFLSLFGIFIGYLIINICFYLERQRMQGDYCVDLAIFGGGKLFSHPKAKNNPIEAMILNEKDSKGYKSEIKKLKSVGQQFGRTEKWWLAGVIISFLCTVIGIVFIFYSFFVSSQSAERDCDRHMSMQSQPFAKKLR